MTRVGLLQGGLAVALVALALGSCQSPEAFHITGDGSLLNTIDGGDATGGTIAPTGGMVGSGGHAGAGAGGNPGHGGAATGSGGATSSGGTGGVATGSGGATGGTASGGSGGNSDIGGRGGTNPGSGGAIGGVGGSATGSGGGGGKGGTPGGGGKGGGVGGKGGGAGGAVGTGPCAGLCSNPIIYTGPSYNSGNLGTGATCHQTMATLMGGNCSNFASPRTLKVNDVTVTCDNSMNWAPGPKRAGGYCLQASAGQQTYASFTTF